MSNIFTCALSGQNPIKDPVALPTGQICSKSLLLKKLTETSNTNPFDPTGNTQVDESQLVEIQTTNEIIPPRTTASNSIPSILNSLSSEYDALVLELFDTRKALEETRKELSLALYQNDAAVRVIARVVLERDMARRELTTMVSSANVTAPAATVAGADAGNKRKRANGDADANADAGGSPDANMDVDVVPQEEDKVGAIPSGIQDQLKGKWKELSATRKAKTKQTGSYPTPDDISAYAVQKKSYHKTSAKGISALAGDLINTSTTAGTAENSKSIIVSSSKDKQLVFYDVEKGKVGNAMGIKTIIPSAKLMSCVGSTMALVGDDDLLRVSVGVGDSNSLLDTTFEIKDVVGVAVHPTEAHVIVAQKDGSMNLFAIDSEKQTFESAAVWSTGSDHGCSSIGLHPDGLLLGIGRENGSIGLWDLSSQKMATTFETNGAAISAISFSEKGVHIATANTEGTVSVWDLRKQKSIATITADANATVECLSFCPIGKYLAYGTGKGDVIVTVVKDWDKKIVMSDGKSRITGLVWGKNAKSVIVTSDSSRVVKLWEAKA